MEKMARKCVPILEVIRFHTEDVIVTSGDPIASSFSRVTPLSDNRYFTSGPERKQDPDAGSATNRYYYKFNMVDGKLEFDSNAFLIDDVYNEIWAWYDQGDWYTEWKDKTYYKAGSTYDWRKDNRTN